MFSFAFYFIAILLLVSFFSNTYFGCEDKDAVFFLLLSGNSFLIFSISYFSSLHKRDVLLFFGFVLV